MMQGFYQALLGSGGNPFDIVSVGSFSTIQFPKTVPFANVQWVLPTYALATLRNASVVKLLITWSAGSYDETTSATYTLTGTLTLSGGVLNPDSLTASIDVEVVASSTPASDLDNLVFYAFSNYLAASGQINQLTNDVNSSNDLVKVTDATRPNENATGFNGHPQYDYTRANSDRLRSEVAPSPTTDVSYDIIFKTSDVTLTQYLLETTSNGTAFGNTGYDSLITSSKIRSSFRKNDAGDNQILDAPFTSTGWNVLSVRFISNTTLSTIIIKLNGSLLFNKYGKDAIVFNSNLLGFGKAKNGTTSLSGSLAGLVMTSDVITSLESKKMLTYFKEYGGANLDFSNYYDENNVAFLNQGISGEAWNGLDKILRNDNKYDFIGASLTGKVYYFEQGATRFDWTSTLLYDTGLEIQSLEILGRDSSNRLVILTLHKDGTTTGDNTGKAVIGRADTTDDKGTYSYADLFSLDFPQHAIVYDYEGNGKMQATIFYQGKTSGTIGGIKRITCNDLSGVLTPGNWTITNHYNHPSAWWGIRYNLNGVTPGYLFTSRTDNRNSSEIPGVYFYSDAGALTTIDNTDLDFGHVIVGDFLGNGNEDILVGNFSNDDLYCYDSGSSYSKSTLVTGGSSEVTYNLVKANYQINGRDSFLHVVENQWGYRGYYDNVSAFTRLKVFAAGVHPCDNGGQHLDVDNSGFLNWVVDFNTDTVEANIQCFL